MTTQAGSLSNNILSGSVKPSQSSRRKGILDTLRVLAVFATTSSLVQSVATASTEVDNNSDKRPNVVFLVADDLGYADLGFHGGKQIPTPHLDALAQSGVRFTSGYVSGPYCSPTRAGLLTGRYQQRFGHEFNPSGNGNGLPISETTIANRLQKAGYKTALVGKWHLGNRPELRPQQRGFEEFYGFLGGANAFLPNKQGIVPNILRGDEPVEEKRYLTDAIAEESIDFIDRNKANPFFLYVAFNAVHTPMHADDVRLQKFASIEDEQRRTYAAMLSAMDDAVGNIVRKLTAEGLLDDTLIAFISDNGGPTMPTTTINGSINEPLRGSKRQTLEGGVRVPFVLSWKGKIPAGVVKHDPVIQLDLQPTALSAASVQYGGTDQFDGVNLLPYVGGTSDAIPHESLFWRFGEQDAIRKGKWKLVRYGRNQEIDKTEKWPKLYNLESDIGETNDVSDANPEIVKELQADWEEWNKGNIEPAWPANQGARGNNAANNNAS